MTRPDARLLAVWIVASVLVLVWLILQLVGVVTGMAGGIGALILLVLTFVAVVIVDR